VLTTEAIRANWLVGSVDAAAYVSRGGRRVLVDPDILVGQAGHRRPLDNEDVDRLVEGRYATDADGGSRA
jgi:hypothetical protein